MKIITVFGSAFTSPDDKLYLQVEDIGKILAQNNITVCTGGFGGVMEAVSKGAKSAGGKTIGVTVEQWQKKPNKYIDEEIKMPNLMERVMELIALGDAYIILKGGTGTLVEISVALELMNKKAMKEKPMIFFTDFWRNLIEILKPDSAKLAELIERNVKIINKPEEVIDYIK
jgi:uncharacterized protein (TIGR00730 family)